MTRSDIRLSWGGGTPAAVWDPLHGMRSWPHDLNPAEGRPSGMDVSDDRWNNGVRPVYQSWSGFTGVVLATRLHPMTVQLGTLRTDTVRWEAKSPDRSPVDWDQSGERHIFAVHEHLTCTGDLLVWWADDQMILTPADRLGDVLLGNLEPEEWLEVSQTAYVANQWDARVVESRCGVIDGAREWGRREFLRSLRAVNARHLQIGRLNVGHDRVRDFPGLGIVGVLEAPADTDPRHNRLAVYRRSAGMLVDRLAEDLPVDWQPREWAEEWDLWPDVLFDQSGRWIAPGQDGELVFGPCGCHSKDFIEWTDTDPFTDLLINPHRVPDHPTCVSDNWHRHYTSRPTRNRTAAETTPSEPEGNHHVDTH